MVILGYGAKNFFCFREGINISFALGANCPNFISGGKYYTNVLGIKGANASGKTNALKVLSFLSEVCCNSFSYKPEAEIHFQPFFYSKDSTDFYVEFEIRNVAYRYELSLTREKIIYECLYRKKNRRIKVIERNGDTISYASSAFSAVKLIKVRSNASVISTAHQYEIKSMQEIYFFFRRIISNVTFHGFSDDDRERYLNVSKYYYENKDIFNSVKDIILKCDTGISDIQILKRKAEDGTEVYFPAFIHMVNGKPKKLIYNFESSGTQSLYNQLSSYVLTLQIGGFLILDEFDIYIHPHLLPLLLNYFLDPKLNINNAQIIFSTHNTEILDYLGKYRTILVNKVDNESFCYRLDEIPGDIVRNDRSIVPLYNSGKIGGVGNYGFQ